MKIIYGDFESYYDKIYSIKKMTPIEYILDPRWETIGCGIGIGNEGPIRFVEGDGIADVLRGIKRPWCFISYNALFDACVLAYRYNIHPDYLIDTLGMTRAMVQHAIPNGRANLDEVANFFSLPNKHGSGLIPGYHLDTYRSTGTLLDLKRYCCHDTFLLREITKKLILRFPKQELKIMDMILKLATQPKFYSDTLKLSEHLAIVLQSKEQLLQRIGKVRSQLLSSEQFAEILRSFGIDPPMKPSPTGNGDIYAFARTDEGMQELLEHPNPDIQALAAARLGIKSTLEETRTKRFIAVGQITQQVLGQPWMPIALRYGAAHTHRFGGEWKLNQQNLPARAKKSKKLKESLIAPPGYIVLEIDAAQIQARLVAWIAGQSDLLEKFSITGFDVYAWFGSEFLGYEITKTTNPVERFNFKTIVLALGFQMGDNKLLTKLTIDAAEAGYDITYTLSQCGIWVAYYRNRFKAIRNLWYKLHTLLPYMADSYYKDKEIDCIGSCIFTYQQIILPSGLSIYYDNLQQINGEWKYTWGREKRKIYGGKILENIAQALDRQHVMEAAIRIEERTTAAGMKVKLAHQAHDALIYVPPIEELDILRIIAEEEMKRQPSWGIGLPLDAESSIGPNYGELK